MNKLLKTGIVLLLLVGLMAGCTPTGGDGTDAPAAEGKYTVKVVDGGGKPCTSGVIVRLMKDGEQVYMQAVNGQGEVSKVLPDGDYTVELQFTSDSDAFHYDREGLELSAEHRELEIRLVPKLTGDPVEIHDGTNPGTAYRVDTGYTYVPLEDGQRNYFLFSATTPGTYRFTTSDPKAAIGLYGYTAYIRENSIVEVKDNEMVLSISTSMVGSEGMTVPYVLGVDADGVEGCTLVIERTGDPQYSIEDDEPWVVYKPTEELAPYVLPQGIVREFDLTADGYTLVFSEDDGYYHLNTADGPLVLMRLYSETKYLNSFQEITSTTGVKKYFYDEDGKFVKREDYTQCLKDYCEMSDEEEGLYPLTEDLKYILQNHGEYAGWWDADSPGFLFMDDEGNRLVGLNPEIAWLFACCYLEQ